MQQQQNKIEDFLQEANMKQEASVSCQFASVGINKCWHVACLACRLTCAIYALTHTCMHKIIPFKYMLLSVLMTARTRAHTHTHSYGMYIPAIACCCCRRVMRRRGGRCRLCVVPIKYAKPISDRIQLAAGNCDRFDSVHTLLPLLLLLFLIVFLLLF